MKTRIFLACLCALLLGVTFSLCRENWKLREQNARLESANKSLSANPEKTIYVDRDGKTTVR